jgi:hypothetical protein
VGSPTGDLRAGPRQLAREVRLAAGAANDYIFAIIGEELGLVGCIVVLVLFTLFAIGPSTIIRKTHDPFIRIVSGGITVWIVGQAIVNMGVVLRIFPFWACPAVHVSGRHVAPVGACRVRCAPVVRAHAARVRPLRSRGDRTGPLRFEQTATLEPMSTEHRAPTYLLAGGGPPGT